MPVTICFPKLLFCADSATYEFQAVHKMWIKQQRSRLFQDEPETRNEKPETALFSRFIQRQNHTRIRGHPRMIRIRRG
jgi:hypothetical protein